MFQWPQQFDQWRFDTTFRSETTCAHGCTTRWREFPAITTGHPRDALKPLTGTKPVELTEVVPVTIGAALLSTAPVPVDRRF